MEDTKELITTDDIRGKVYIIRGQQVMLDKDLAEIYGYEVKRLNEHVKRNISRFPEDFMFQLNREEIPEGFSKSQFATLNEKSNRQGSNIKKMPFAFTEQGIYMLATVLRGELAEQQSIFIMRTFREMRHYIKQNQQFVTRSEMELLSSTNPLFDAALIRRIIQNPVYSGKISYGRRRTEKVHGTRNEYRQVKKDDYLLVDGLHEALVSEEVWEQAQVKVAAQAKKYEKVNRDKREKIHLLSGILKCPVCGAGMYGNKSIKKRKDGSNYKDFYYYGCKHRNMTRGHKWDYKKQVHEEMLDASVAEVISNSKFSDLIRNKINMEVDTSALDQEIENYKIQLRKLYHNKDTILSDMDSLDYEDKHYQRRKTDLENHLYKTYDKIDDAEELLVSAKAKKRSLLADKITGDNIYKALVFFDKLYAQMNEAEKREFLSQLVDNVQIYEERKENGQWLKSIEFKLPIIEKEFTLSLDNDTQNETVCEMERI